MNAGRLLKLADHLDKVPPRRFKMDRWKCKMAACAIGHASDIPSFRRAGLRMVQCEDDENQKSPVFLGREDMEAVEVFFDVDDDESFYLFGGGHKRTVKQQVKIIRQFVERKQLESQKEFLEKRLAKLPEVTGANYPSWD